MLNHKFGIEIEFTGITRNKAAKIAAKFLEGTISVCRDYYNTYSVTARDGRVWKFMSDGSILCQKKQDGQTVAANKVYTLTLGRHTVELNAPDKYCVLDGTRKDINMSYVPDFPSSTTPVALCAARNGSQIMGVSGVTLYSCQIWDNGILIRDYIPCKDPSGKVGVYDAVEQAFNVGVGTFTAGPAV